MVVVDCDDDDDDDVDMMMRSASHPIGMWGLKEKHSKKQAKMISKLRQRLHDLGQWW